MAATTAATALARAVMGRESRTTVRQRRAGIQPRGRVTRADAQASTGRGAVYWCREHPHATPTRIPEKKHTMSQKEPTPQDRQGLQVGDRVQILTNIVKAPVGTIGTIMGFTAGAHHPLVEVVGRGRCLIPALSLVRQD
jgi:hypothetical protein